MLEGMTARDREELKSMFKAEIAEMVAAQNASQQSEVGSMRWVDELKAALGHINNAEMKLEEAGNYEHEDDLVEAYNFIQSALRKADGSSTDGTQP